MLHDRGFVLILLSAVLSLTVLSATGAMMLVWRSAPSTRVSERLIDTLIWIATTGFFTVLGLLAAIAHV